MPMYEYYCKECSAKAEIYKKMDEPHPKDCLLCQTKGSMIQDYSSVGGIVELSQPKTISELADKNTERLVSEGKVDKKSLEWREERKEKQKKSNRMKEIASMTKQQKRNYIMTGDKNG